MEVERITYQSTEPKRTYFNNNSGNKYFVNYSSKECVYIIDLKTNKITFKKGFNSLLGYQDHDISFDLLSNSIHPDDKEIVVQLYQEILQFYLSNPESCTTSSLYCNYRGKKKDGTYTKILSQSSIYEMDDNGIMKSILTKLTNISFMDNSSCIQWSFEAANFDRVKIKNQIYKDYRKIFTKREIEIINKIEKFFTSKEIAKKLNISEHTVATHRKNIFKKAKCHNSEELIKFCKGKGIL